MNGVAFCLVGIPPFPETEEKGRRDGISLSNENMQAALGESMAWQGPRTVVLRKNSQGFGFTLRHFIVYPPESALHTRLKDEENGNGKGYQRGRLEPMDTIFVKNVRESGPAHLAGLCTGDRLVKVNGESILGRTYSQVIALIQNSDAVLELSIMPKDEDVLQLAYSQDAYLKGNEPFMGGAQNLPEPPPACYPRGEAQQPTSVGQSQLDNWSGLHSPSSSLDNHISARSLPAWQEERGQDLRGIAGQSGLAHSTYKPEDVQQRTSRPAAVGQARGRSASSGGALFSPLHFHFANHNAAIASASQPQPDHSRSELCHQALSDWYYSQMPPRRRSFSQDRLAEVGRVLGQHRTGWPHSASQDTLLQPSHIPHTDHHWTGRWGDACTQSPSHGHSDNLLAAALVSPQFEKPGWLEQAQRAPCRTESHLRAGGRCGAAPAVPAGQQAQSQQQPGKLPQPATQPRPLPPQTRDDQPVGYRSYSPSFYRKAGHLMQVHSFKDPAYSGPNFTWTPTPKTSPPDNAPTQALEAGPSHPAVPEPQPQEGIFRLTNHERAGAEREVVMPPTQEVVLRLKPPTGRRVPHALRHPNYALPVNAANSPEFPAEPLDSASDAPHLGDKLSHVPQRSVEDDSLASIPYIDEPTSPSADLRARHVPASSVVSSIMSSVPAVATSPVSPTFTFPLTRLFSHDCSNTKAGRRSSYLLAITTERSKSCDEGLNSFRDEGRVFSRLPKRVKSFFTDGSLESLGAREDTRSKRHSTSELGNITFSDVRKEGWLHYKQILDGKGKKVGSVMRPWKRVYSVLRSHSLFMYKDKREAVLHGTAAGGGGGMGPGHGEEEQPISVRGCLVDIAYSETKRKHALRLSTQDFCEYLLQAEDREDMLAWIKVIHENSKTDSEELGLSRQALINKKLNDYRKHSQMSSKPDSSPRVPRMKPPFLLAKMETTGGAPRSPKPEGKDESSPPKSPWGINIMKKAKKSAPKAFGVRLEDCQPAVNNKFIPLIVEICCGLVEEMGLEYTGIYRVPGNNAMVSSLQDQLNKGMEINPAEEKWQDLNVISSLLKSFFRKLPEPLFTDDKYNDFIDANRLEDAGERMKTMKKLIHDLPDYYYHTLKFLIGHLKTVADHSEKNRMEPRNLALVFGPTLVRTSEDNMTEMVTHMPDRYKIIETLILHHAWVFSEELAKDEKTPVDKGEMQPVPNIDHLLSNIGRTAVLGEASDSTNSDSAKSKGSWGSKRDVSAKDFLPLSFMFGVNRKRRRCPHARFPGSSTDEDSEHEPVSASTCTDQGPKEGEGVEPTGSADATPPVEGEEEPDEADGKDRRVEVEIESPERPREAERVTAVLLKEGGRVGVSGQPWRGPDDARSIVSGYSTLSTLGRSLASEGHGEEADDEHSELVSETDNESGFASRSLTQERPEKPTRPPPQESFHYTHCKPPALAGDVPGPRPPPTPLDVGNEGRAHSATPSSSSFSSATTRKMQSRTSFNSHKLIQCDTLARKKQKGEKAKARSVDMDFGPDLEPSSKDSTTTPEAQCSKGGAPRTKASSLSSQESFRLTPTPVKPLDSPPAKEAASLSLAEQVRARLLGSASDLRSVGLRKPVSPETRRKKSAWRRHTVVVNLSGLEAPMDSAPGKRLLHIDTPAADIELPNIRPRGAFHSSGPYIVTPPFNRSADAALHTASRFHQYL